MDSPPSSTPPAFLRIICSRHDGSANRFINLEADRLQLMTRSDVRSLLSEVLHELGWSVDSVQRVIERRQVVRQSDGPEPH